MKISKKWLQSYFEEKLPTADVIADAITFHLCEIESVEKIEAKIKIGNGSKRSGVGVEPVMMREQS